MIQKERDSYNVTNPKHLRQRVERLEFQMPSEAAQMSEEEF
jgi:hypothetical protein